MRAAGRESTHRGDSCAHAPGGPTVDLLATLDELRAMAKQAQLDLAAGVAVTGTTALRRIELAAADAARWARKDAA
jgi:hypothetical protein